MIAAEQSHTLSMFKANNENAITQLLAKPKHLFGLNYLSHINYKSLEDLVLQMGFSSALSLS